MQRRQVYRIRTEQRGENKCVILTVACVLAVLDILSVIYVNHSKGEKVSMSDLKDESLRSITNVFLLYYGMNDTCKMAC